MCEIDRFVSVDEAARMLETTGPRVLMMLKRGEIKGELEGETWQVHKASLELCGKPHPPATAGRSGCGGGCGGCHGGES